jgi:hypothetical protein
VHGGHDERVETDSLIPFYVELEEFHEIIKGVLEVMEGQSRRIEREKLKVITESWSAHVLRA